MGTELGRRNGTARRRFYKIFPITFSMSPCTGSVKIRNSMFDIN
jgi:hypothetical protein